jgi:hypothetical protein
MELLERMESSILSSLLERTGFPFPRSSKTPHSSRLLRLPSYTSGPSLSYSRLKDGLTRNRRFDGYKSPEFTTLAMGRLLGDLKFSMNKARYQKSGVNEKGLKLAVYGTSRPLHLHYLTDSILLSQHVTIRA